MKEKESLEDGPNALKVLANLAAFATACFIGAFVWELTKVVV